MFETCLMCRIWRNFTLSFAFVPDASAVRFVVMDFLKNRYNKGKESNLYFYRDSNQNEVDLLLRTGNSFEIKEIKSSMTYSPDFEKGLQYFSEIFKNRVTDKQIIYCGELESETNDVKLRNFRSLGVWPNPSTYPAHSSTSPPPW